MKNLQWGRGRAKHKASVAGSLDKAGRVARAINWRVQHERSKAATAARERCALAAPPGSIRRSLHSRAKCSEHRPGDREPDRYRYPSRQNLPADQVGQHVPFNGYMFRILTSQGRHAPGGVKKYVVNGKMSAGFAFVAYPVEYRSSGVMTFIVDQSGTIYEKDLGPGTTRLAQAMTVYDPDSTWHKVE